ncbi:MAG: hypothetical protein IKD70_04585, partial [Eggerthellaceae bacterium]|nr:hypothetical protein [Eggerthellaceae bacterium]
AAAGNPRLTEEALATLAQDTDARVRAEVAQSAAATPAILGALAKDASPDIRVRVARNGNTPEEVLIALAKDADPDVRSAVCTNPRIPESALLELAADADTWIAEHARKYIRIRRGEAARSADAAAQIRDASESRRERGYVRSFLRHLTLMTEHRGAHDDDR